MRSGSPKPAALGDAVDRLAAGLDPRARRFDPQALDRLGGGDAGLGGEGAGEMARAHRGALRQSFDAQRLVQPLARPGRAGRRSGPSGRSSSSRAENCDWPPGPAVIDHQLLRGRRATSSPRSSAIRASARSMPAVMPAEVQTGPSRTKMRSGSSRTFGKRRAKSAVRDQWVVARRPSSRPAAARTKAPEQTLATRPALAAAARHEGERGRSLDGLARARRRRRHQRVERRAGVGPRRPCATPEELAHRRRPSAP